MTTPERRPGRRPRPWLTALGTSALLVGAACAGDELQNRQLLETLPRDRRATLAENLDQFDRLDAAERTAIRRLDKSIEVSDPVEQARFRAQLHRYHLWFQGLADDQQAALLAISDHDERFQAALKLRREETGVPPRDGPRIARIRIGEYGMLGPFEAAFLLKVWQKAPPDRKADLAKKPPVKIRDELKASAGTLGIKFEPFPPGQEQERTYAAKLQADDEFKPLLEPIQRRLEQAARKGEPTKKADNAQKRLEHPYAEFLYFEEKTNRPRAVTPELLERFSESCPDWFHKMTDSLSADDARDYCTLVYRLIYPTGEMPEPPKPTKAAPEPAARKAAPAKPDPNAPAF